MMTKIDEYEKKLYPEAVEFRRYIN